MTSKTFAFLCPAFFLTLICHADFSSSHPFSAQQKHSQFAQERLPVVQGWGRDEAWRSALFRLTRKDEGNET